MGQTWCRERTSKSQDSKSPLDRVFLRCAHRIYPGLKEEGSVLGGATQRVTSSEIGYASSPPRSALARGHSIDSVDRPFHPSEWVDVNLEVPGTPTLATSYVTPVPPPRKRKKNRGRSLPPKPDDGDSNDDPLYSSVKYIYDNAEESVQRTKEIYEHKVNGTGRVIPSDVVSRRSGSFDKRVSDVKNHCKVSCKDECERLFKLSELNNARRPKNCSTCSLPNYDELRNATRDEKVTKISSTGTLFTQKKKNDKVEPVEENTTINVETGRRERDDNSIRQIVDFADSAERPLKLESTARTSTPMKGAIGDDSISRKKLDEWFRRRERNTNSTFELEHNFHTAVQDDSSTKLNLLRRTLSNESEPFESFEEKELSLQPFGKLVRTISEESLPQEMLEDVDFFEDKTVGESQEETISKTPPPSPEPKIEAEIVKNDHHPCSSSKRKKIVNDQGEEGGSNLSSMTPSLTELEAALSDMLEKKEDENEPAERDGKTPEEDKSEVESCLIEPKIVPEKKQVEIVGFDFKKKPDRNMEGFKSEEDSKLSDPPEKPSRMRPVNFEESPAENAPTPPRRRNRSSSSIVQKENSGTTDRLI